MPSECGAMYLAAPWLELHEHVTDHLGDVLLKGAEGEAAQPSAGIGARTRRILSQCPERSGQLEEVEGLVLLEARERLLALALHLVRNTY